VVAQQVKLTIQETQVAHKDMLQVAVELVE
jgi:hypothetical protein